MLTCLFFSDIVFNGGIWHKGNTSHPFSHQQLISMNCLVLWIHFSIASSQMNQNSLSITTLPHKKDWWTLRNSTNLGQRLQSQGDSICSKNYLWSEWKWGYVLPLQWSLILSLDIVDCLPPIRAWAPSKGCRAVVRHAARQQHATGSARTQMASFLFTNLTEATVADLRGRFEPGQPKEAHPWFSRQLSLEPLGSYYEVPRTDYSQGSSICVAI